MPNRVIELRNMHVQRVAICAESVILNTYARVHASTGRPGIDAGSVWSQPVRFSILQGRVVRRDAFDRLVVTTASVRVGEREYDSLMPPDLDADRDTRLFLGGAEGVIEVAGLGIRVCVSGEASYVDEWAGDKT